MEGKGKKFPPSRGSGRRCRRSGSTEIRVDGLGNILGRIGQGQARHRPWTRTSTLWAWATPAAGRTTRTRAGSRTASSTGAAPRTRRAAMASMVYAGKVIKDLKLEGDYTSGSTGTVMEEDCDGLCWPVHPEGEGAPAAAEIVVIHGTDEPEHLPRGTVEGWRSRWRRRSLVPWLRPRSAVTTPSTRWPPSSPTSRS